MSTPQALIVDDEPDIRELLELTLGRMNIDTRSAANLAMAWNWSRSFSSNIRNFPWRSSPPTAIWKPRYRP
jgi:DNA-binding NtrC family response regulator